MKAYARVSVLVGLRLKTHAITGTTFVSASRRNGSQEAWDCKVFCGNPTVYAFRY